MSQTINHQSSGDSQRSSMDEHLTRLTKKNPTFLHQPRLIITELLLVVWWELRPVKLVISEIIHQASTLRRAARQKDGCKLTTDRNGGSDSCALA